MSGANHSRVDESEMLGAKTHRETEAGGEPAEPMTPTEERSFIRTALTQLNGHPERCANPFCDGVAKRSPRGKHGRYCSDHCRLDGYVLRRVKTMIDRKSVV